jgi:hypothetical protein
MNPIHQQFFGLLRLALNGTPFTAEPGEEEWSAVYRMAREQSLTGVLYAVVATLPTEQQPPMALAMQWVSEAEAIRGMNQVQYQEAARLTKLFGDAGRRTAILKGQANARLYPDPLTRQPGDIDLWVEGGRESVLELLATEPFAAMTGGKLKPSYHHAHLPKNSQGVDVEIHYRPSSGNFNPMTNRPLQRWLEREIAHTTMVEEGFHVPSVRFALVMQLSHIQRHFLGVGIGLRHVCDYYMLLRHSTAEDRQAVAANMRKFGLRSTAGALMWVLGEVMQMEPDMMPCEKDSRRGEWMLREIMAGGNFGKYAQRQQLGFLRRVFSSRWRHIRLMRFDFWEVLWQELYFWKAVIKTIPTRIRYRTLSLRNAPI